MDEQKDYKEIWRKGTFSLALFFWNFLNLVFMYICIFAYKQEL